ncbi:hypothetical protein IWQ62_001169 [Dispira parvispora]|uniref:Uncharacterized protein n=1 Tax=Dispira parvispora TaxID=1520584 RepID=A0A9W8E596_9FUNG|nr:hypothetical protein IWQ62_001169 [Dispira parvispora]
MSKARKRSSKDHSSQGPNALPLTGMKNLNSGVVDYTWVPPGNPSGGLSAPLSHLMSYNLTRIAQMMNVLVQELLSASRQLLLILVALVAGILLVTVKAMAVALRLLSRMRRSLTLASLGEWYEKQVPLSTQTGYTCVPCASPAHLNTNNGQTRFRQSPTLPVDTHDHKDQVPVSFYCYRVSPASRVSPPSEYVHECETGPITHMTNPSPNIHQQPLLLTPCNNSSKYSPRHLSMPENLPRRCYYSLPGSRRGSCSELPGNQEIQSVHASHPTRDGENRWGQTPDRANIYTVNNGMQPYPADRPPRFGQANETQRARETSGNEFSSFLKRPTSLHSGDRTNSDSLPSSYPGLRMASFPRSRPDRGTSDGSHDGNRRMSTHLPSFLLRRRHSTSHDSPDKLRRRLLRERLSRIFRSGRSQSTTPYTRSNQSDFPTQMRATHSRTSSSSSLPNNDHEVNGQKPILPIPTENPAFQPQHRSASSPTEGGEQDNLNQVNTPLCFCSDIESPMSYPSPAPSISPA